MSLIPATVRANSPSLADVYAWDNLLLARRHAANGKRGKPAVAEFDLQMADQLLALQAELLSGCYRPGPYHHFVIHEPKRRKISAAPFRDRVVHHALCNVIEPLFEARFITHSFANRVGKGTHRAVDALQHCVRRYRYALRLDVVQHFPSLDHAVLRAELWRVLTDSGLRGLIDRILDSGTHVLADQYTPVLFEGDDIFALARPRGLPIGNLTSQFWSNVYMNPLDWFVLRELGAGGRYLRYVDDLALFSDSKAELATWREAIVARLARMRLTAHSNSAQVACTAQGVPWLGFVVFPTYRRLKRRNVVAFARRFARNTALYAAGRMSFAELDASVQGWVNHVRYADTWHLREHIFGQKFFSRERGTPLSRSPLSDSAQ